VCALSIVMLLLAVVLLVFAVGLIIGYVLSYLYSSTARNSEDADERRRRNTFKVPSGKTNLEDVNINREWTPNERGMLLSRQQFIPSGEFRGVICMCHGFGDHSQEFMFDLAIRFCRQGYAAISMDAEGHG
jgi:predicted alpha/beta-fold hydrolase